MAEENEEIESEDVDGDGEDGAEGKKKPGIMKLALFIGLPVLILLLGGTAAFLLLSGGGDGEHAVADAGEHGEADASGHGGGQGNGGHDEEVYIASFPDITVSIVDARGGNAILTLSLSFETPEEDLGHVLLESDGETLTLEGRRLVDQYMGFLRELRPEDLAGSAGMQRIRMELLRRAQLVLGEERVNSVLITNLLIV
ncbi:flagellar basal body-associated FliL family protein [Hyphobacterium sp.]|jgi:flagellar FliL protein|uniref:flagellar basal body-associated FliL family protein n=1 Tax=Hyphobacterium sp. TaxID=2004662 RepID=UPI003BAD9664